MMFDRRHKQSLGARARNLIWPRSGWQRASRYLAHRVRRLPGTPYAIAAGFACGAAVSMTPFPGLHFVLSGLLAWIIGASILASAIGTAVGNPWTFPFIWIWIYKLGSWILGSGNELGTDIITLSFLLDHPMDVLLPMMVGSVPTAILIWLVFFWPIKRMVHSYQCHRSDHLARRALTREGSGGAQ
jgi:uncharacterized protein (DUF2062 family)